MIYLDNAATTLQKPPEVVEAVMYAMGHMGNSARGVHEESLTASRIVYSTREAVAKLFHCERADHVIFTSNSTEALNTAILGTIQAGDHVITTDLEHNSVLRPLYRLEREREVSLSFVEADKKGRIRYEDFLKKKRENTRAIVCTHASNLTGNVLDLEKIGEIAKCLGLLFIVDASQTAGVLPIDMQRMKIDILCFTGHKSLFGPQGTGGLCVRPDIDISPLKVGGSGIHTYDKEQPRELPTRLEAGTLNGQENDTENIDVYSEFVKDIDTVMMGWNTYHQVVTELSPNDWIYKDFMTYVFTHKKEKSSEQIRFTSENPVSLLEQLKVKDGKGIWICGGAHIVQQLINGNMIDEYYISVIPTILGGGIRLFENTEQEVKLKLLKTQTYNGITDLVYVRR